jgi:hypothetical protein
VCLFSSYVCVVENDSISDAITITTNRQSYIKHTTRAHCICTNDDNTLADGGRSSNGKLDTPETHRVREKKKRMIEGSTSSIMLVLRRLASNTHTYIQW